MNEPRDDTREGLAVEWPEDAEDAERLPLTDVVAAGDPHAGGERAMVRV